MSFRYITDLVKKWLNVCLCLWPTRHINIYFWLSVHVMKPTWHTQSGLQTHSLQTTASRLQPQAYRLTVGLLLKFGFKVWVIFTCNCFTKHSPILVLFLFHLIQSDQFTYQLFSLLSPYTFVAFHFISLFCQTLQA